MTSQPCSLVTDQNRGPLLVSVCEASRVGKSVLAKAAVARLGDEVCARVPADYVIAPATAATDIFRRPMQYDWAEPERALTAPMGRRVTTPAFDFVAFRRSVGAETRPFVMCPVMIVDAIYLYPKADVTVLIETPAATRQARIVARDREWGTRVADRRTQLEASRVWLEQRPLAHDLRLAGEGPEAKNADPIVRLLAGRHALPI